MHNSDKHRWLWAFQYLQNPFEIHKNRTHTLRCFHIDDTVLNTDEIKYYALV